MNTNEKKEITIRIAKRNEDAEELLAIYAPYIEHTVITYEYDVPTVEEFRGRIRHVLERYPYLVAEVNGEICGYAYAMCFSRETGRRMECRDVYLRGSRIKKEW